VFQVVLVAGKKAAVKFIGTTSFAGGVWIGAELVSGVGKNDGSVKGKRSRFSFSFSFLFVF
jgi:dynactin 1